MALIRSSGMDAVKSARGLIMNKNSQDNQVLAYLKHGNTISQEEAIHFFNCYRLSSVINRLRNAGYKIITHREPNKVSVGNHARYEYKGVAE